MSPEFSGEYAELGLYDNLTIPEHKTYKTFAVCTNCGERIVIVLAVGAVRPIHVKSPCLECGVENCIVTGASWEQIEHKLKQEGW